MATIRKTTYDSRDAVEIRTSALQIFATYCCGPRIAHLSRPEEDNLLLWAPGKYGRGAWDLRGGHRVWATRPGADECEDTYATDNRPCDVQVQDNRVVITGAENPENHTRRGFAITVLAENRLEIDNFLINCSEMLYSCGVWALTCTLPKEDARYAIPLGDGSSWDTFAMVHFREWAGHGQGGFADPQFDIGAETLVITPRGVENKRMIQCPKGILAMTAAERDLTFAKRIKHDPTGEYPLNTNLAIYVGPDNFMVEMETMGPEQTLKPGQELHHVETWVLKPGTIDPRSATAVEALFDTP